jgi:hypothetical protein
MLAEIKPSGGGQKGLRSPSVNVEGQEIGIKEKASSPPSPQPFVEYLAVYRRLPPSRRVVLDALRRWGPQTANQIASLRPKNGLDNASVRSRLSELVQQHLVTRIRKVIDPVSHHRAFLYRALLPDETNPCELPRRVTRAELEAEVERLRHLCREWEAWHDGLEEDLQQLLACP